MALSGQEGGKRRYERERLLRLEESEQERHEDEQERTDERLVKRGRDERATAHTGKAIEASRT